MDIKKINIYKIITYVFIGAFLIGTAAAVVVNIDGSGLISQLITSAKGDLIVRNATANTRQSVGGNGDRLAANSSTDTGVQWVARTVPVFLMNSTASCTNNALSIKMAGLNVNYTTSGNTSGTIFVTLNFQITSPATTTINSQYQLAYGTGTAPVCNAVSTGTLVGNQYKVSTVAAIATSFAQEETVAISGLSPNTKYWIDVRANPSTNVAWIYSLPQLTVIEP